MRVSNLVFWQLLYVLAKASARFVRKSTPAFRASRYFQCSSFWMADSASTVTKATDEPEMNFLMGGSLCDDRVEEVSTCGCSASSMSVSSAALSSPSMPLLYLHCSNTITTCASQSMPEICHVVAELLTRALQSQTTCLQLNPGHRLMITTCLVCKAAARFVEEKQPIVTWSGNDGQAQKALMHTPRQSARTHR